MSNQDKDSKVLMGLLIGGIIGMGALTVFVAKKQGKTISLHSLGQAIVSIGEIMEGRAAEAPVKGSKKKAARNDDRVGDIADWVAAGVDLWKKIKG